ncbi:hypothetical protein EYC80_001969 [Monilinia laxa]|uniref:Ubiquitin carboxyl-terminal hydrolase n=1 Tax=Monilinia laxa TaxID=61186 RepID=A0A5N6K6M5_MONLA|nr:hypothetical protein EYC80_001969 [Monilinia laxa]
MDSDSDLDLDLGVRLQVGDSASSSSGSRRSQESIVLQSGALNIGGFASSSSSNGRSQESIVLQSDALNIGGSASSSSGSGRSQESIVLPLDALNIDGSGNSSSSSGRPKEIIVLPSGALNIDGKKTLTVLENNPEVMNALAANLGLSPALKFYDVYSLTDMELLKDIPRPVYALLVILPLTSTWEESRRARDLARKPYKRYGPGEPVIWFKQTIDNACGSIGLLHCILNSPAREYILPDTILHRLFEDSIPLEPEKRAKMLYDDRQFEVAHQSVATLGDTLPPDAAEGDRLGQHFVAFVRGEDGYLWELEGSRPGPIRKNLMKEDEDLLSENVLWQSVGAVIQRNQQDGDGDMRFSCIALAPDRTEAVSLPLNFPYRGHPGRSEGFKRRSIHDPSYEFEYWSQPLE